MTVASSLAKAGPYIADGTTRTYPFQFRVLDPAHIKVEYEGEMPPYTVALESDGTGSIVFSTAPAEGAKLAILRDVPVTQETDIQNNTAFFPEIWEKSIDKLTMICQQLKEELGRCFKADATDNADSFYYFEDIKNVTINAKDVALNAATAAANSALTASISERNVSLIWAEITGDSSLAENALLTVKDAAEATGAITAAKEIAIGEINGVGSMAIASTQKAAQEAEEAAKKATDSAGAIEETVADAITIQVSQAVGADGVLGVAIAAGVQDVESARQEAIDRANETLSQIQEGSNAFETAKNQGLVEVQNKVNGVALDVETTLARAQIIADKYLEDAQATVSGSIEDLEQMREDATAAGNAELLALINKRIGELNTLSGYLTEAQSAATAAETFKQQAESIVNGFDTTVDSAVTDANGRIDEKATEVLDNISSQVGAADGFASNASTSAAAALQSAQEAALSASEAASSAAAAGSAAGDAAESAANASITLHNSSASAHSALMNAHNNDAGAHGGLTRFLPLNGGVMTGSITAGAPDFAKAPSVDTFLRIMGGTGASDGASLTLSGQNYGQNTHGANGAAVLSAADGTNSSEFVLLPDGRIFMGEKPVIVETDSQGPYREGSSESSIVSQPWFVELGNGLLIQGGRLAVLEDYSDDRTVTFPVPFAFDTTAKASSGISVFITPRTPSGVSSSLNIYWRLTSLTSTGFSFKPKLSTTISDYTVYFHWFAIGYRIQA